MWIRSGIWTGHPADGKADEFATKLEATIMPQIQNLPGVLSATTLWPQRREDSPPDIYRQTMVRFESLADLERKLASPERAAMCPHVCELIQVFDGQLSHIDFQTSPF